MFSESLTVRILGDSSHLRGELDATLGLLDAFEKRLAGLGAVGERLSAGLGGMTSTVGSLELLSQLLTGLQQRLESLRQSPLTINVQPALAALGKLSAAIEAVASRLAGLAAMSAASGAKGGGASPLGVVPSPASRAATASAAASPFTATATSAALPDRSPLADSFPGGSAAGHLPSRLATSEQMPLLAAVAVPRFHRLPEASSETPSTDAALTAFLTHSPRPEVPLAVSRTAAAPPPVMTTNHFGGITIQVREAADVNTLIRDLRLQGIHLRNRRG
jgi:hypothetical protein